MAENLLFATLDPTLRQLSLPGIDKAILSDTVGFVSDLPTQLVAAFKATLEEGSRPTCCSTSAISRIPIPKRRRTTSRPC